MENRGYFTLALVATVIALIVIMLGAYTRLSDAGLGCPDWPGCYGQLTVPHTKLAKLIAQKVYPDLVVETAKAWKEMVHRYFAGSLGVIILALAIWGFLRKRHHTEQPVKIPSLLVVLVIFQAALGMCEKVKGVSKVHCWEGAAVTEREAWADNGGVICACPTAEKNLANDNQ